MKYLVTVVKHDYYEDFEINHYSSDSVDDINDYINNSNNNEAIKFVKLENDFPILPKYIKMEFFTAKNDQINLEYKSVLPSEINFEEEKNKVDNFLNSKITDLIKNKTVYNNNINFNFNQSIHFGFLEEDSEEVIKKIKSIKDYLDETNSISNKIYNLQRFLNTKPTINDLSDLRGYLQELKKCIE